MHATLKRRKIQTLVAGGGLVVIGLLLLFVFRLEIAGFDMRTAGIVAVGLGGVLLLSVGLQRRIGIRDERKARRATGVTQILIGGVFVVSGLALLFIVPAHVWWIDMRFMGFILLANGIPWSISGLLIALPEESSVSLGERRALVSLGATLVVASYFVLTMDTINFAVPPRILGEVVGKLATVAITTSAIAGTYRWANALSIVFTDAGVAEDERDAGVHRRAAQWAYALLLLMLAALVILIGFPGHRAALSSPSAITLVLIGIAITSEIVRHGTALWLYRRSGV